MRPQLPDCSCAWKVQNPKCPHHGTGAKPPFEDSAPVAKHWRTFWALACRKGDPLHNPYLTQDAFFAGWLAAFDVIGNIGSRLRDMANECEDSSLPPSHRLYGTDPRD